LKGIVLCGSMFVAIHQQTHTKQIKDLRNSLYQFNNLSTCIDNTEVFSNLS